MQTTTGYDRSSEDSGTPPLRILCVEDNDRDFRLICEYLNHSELSPKPIIHRAHSLADTIRLPGAASGDAVPDIILLDLNLPDSLGLDTLAKITEAFPKTPVTVLSGNADRDFAIWMVQQGAQDYLTKDAIDARSLGRSILYALERHRSRIEMAELNERLARALSDLNSAQMQLIQVEKLDSLGRLAAGVAHEVKNPLGTLQLGVDYFARRRASLGEDAAMMIDHMQEAIERADKIIRGMVDYSRNESLTLSLAEANINRVARSARRLIQHQFTKHQVTLFEEFTDPIPAVNIDAGKIEQVLINLMLNALQAMDGDPSRQCGKKLHLNTFWGRLPHIYRDEGLRKFERLRANDDVVVVELRDEGPGVPEDKINRIFEPFYTTKPAGQGTGLGLYVARNIVELHNGHIEVRNVDQPRGLRVRILLKAVVFHGHTLSQKRRQFTQPVQPISQ